jgi:hypothetical protein
MGRACTEATVDHFQLVLGEVVNLTELREERNQGTEFLADGKLAGLVVALKEQLAFARDESGVPRPANYFAVLVEDEVVLDKARVRLI